MFAFEDFNCLYCLTRSHFNFN